MTTRLSNATKTNALNDLRALLNNVVGFVEFPIKDRSLLASLWNSKFPQDLVEAMRTFGTYNIGMGEGGLTTEKIRWCTNISGKLHCALVKLDEVGPISIEKMNQGHVQYALGMGVGALTKQGIYREIYTDTGDMVGSKTRTQCHEITRQDMLNGLGADLTDEVISWMEQTAVQREELITANRSLQAIFDMAQTAGQIKRMVPDLLQYLPVKQRLAFEEQKRSSTVPFDWAPFPKRDVDVMLTAINKGHLLQNMRRPGRENASVEYLDHNTSWARTDVVWAPPK